ncbi:MAG: oligosaccharide flippase family protein [Acidobacteriales bacterium]|nr:oligosaccharide flippase family protein [Terriglobales bacterium]
MRPLLAGSIGTTRFNLLASSLGYMSYGAAQWAIVIVLARLTSPEAVGRFTLAFAVTAPVFLALDMQLRRIVASDIKGEISHRAALSARLGGCAVSTVVIVVLSACLRYSVVQCQLNLAVALAKSFESISDLLYGYFQQSERMDLIAVSLWLKGIGALAMLWIVQWQTGSVVYATAAVACAWFLLLILFDAPRAWRLCHKRHLRGERTRNTDSWRILLRLSGPLGIALVMASLGQNIPRYVLEARCGQAALGVYAAASHFFVVGARLAMAAADTILPRLSRLANLAPDEFKRLLWRSISPVAVFCITLTIIAVPFGRPLLVQIYGTAYGSGKTTLVIVFLASGVNAFACIFQTGLMALRQINAQLGIAALGAVASLLLSETLVDSLGSAGAAIALAGGVSVHAVLSGVTALATLRSQERTAEGNASATPVASRMM